MVTGFPGYSDRVVGDEGPPGFERGAERFAKEGEVEGGGLVLPLAAELFEGGEATGGS